jgi:hypothetical protein
MGAALPLTANRHPELVSGSISRFSKEASVQGAGQPHGGATPAHSGDAAQWMLEAKLCLHKQVRHDGIRLGRGGAHG